MQIAATHQLDVILLDVMMPDMDGCTALQYLKSNPQTQNIPVILATAKVCSSDLDCFGNLDAAAIFTKPFRPLKLADQIVDVLKVSSS